MAPGLRMSTRFGRPRSATRSQAEAPCHGYGTGSRGSRARRGTDRSYLGRGVVPRNVRGDRVDQAGDDDRSAGGAGALRDRTGVEVDLVVERTDGSVIAIEVKSAATVNRSDGQGLRFLRDRLGDWLMAGVVFHTGPLTVQLDERIWATPISALWGGAGKAVESYEPESGSRPR
jgi:hypothetical protein